MKRRKKSKTLLLIALAYLITFFVLYILLSTGLLSNIFFKASAYAVTLNFLNSLLAISLFLFSYAGTNQQFIIMNLGGLGVRIFLMLVGIIIILKFLKIDLFDFILVFFVFYFVQLILEIRFFYNFNKEK
jgi:hypothetical protein